MTVAPAILTLMDGRPVTRKRWPSGVEEKPFFEKNLPASTPDGVARVTLRHSGERSGRGARDLDYPLVNDVATLVWLARGGALELHAPQGRMDATTGLPAAPDRLVIDLDPGPPAGLDECGTVALLARQMLDAHGLDLRAVTSGSKGIQLYAPLPPATARGREMFSKAGSPAEFTRALALALEREMPHLVVSQMSRDLRPERVFIDWSQNTPPRRRSCHGHFAGSPRPPLPYPSRGMRLRRAACVSGHSPRPSHWSQPKPSSFPGCSAHVAAAEVGFLSASASARERSRVNTA
jgi:bifunctional non-homologous end joining protein LigD